MVIDGKHHFVREGREPREWELVRKDDGELVLKSMGDDSPDFMVAEMRRHDARADHFFRKGFDRAKSLTDDDIGEAISCLNDGAAAADKDAAYSDDGRQYRRFTGRAESLRRVATALEGGDS